MSCQIPGVAFDGEYEHDIDLHARHDTVSMTRQGKARQGKAEIKLFFKLAYFSLLQRFQGKLF